MTDNGNAKSIELGAGRQVAARAMSRIGARAVSSLSFGVFLVLTARSTDISEFGAFMLAYSVGLVAGILTGAGAPVRVLRAAAESNRSTRALFIVHTSSVSLAMTLCLLTFGVIQPQWASVAGIVLAFGDTCQNFATAQTTAEERHVLANTMVVTHRVVPLVTVLVSYVNDSRVGFDLITATLTVPLVVSLLVPCLCLERGCASSGLYAVLISSGRFWIYSTSALLSQLQVPMLAAVATSTVVAQFSMAARVVGPIGILTASISVIVVPELAKRMVAPVEFDRLFRTVLRLSIAYFVAVAAMSWPVAVLVVHIVGPQYDDAMTLVIGMVIGAGISGCSMAFNAKLLAVGHPDGATQAIVAGGIVALMLLAVIGGRNSSSMLWLVPVVSELVVITLMVRASAVTRRVDAK